MSMEMMSSFGTEQFSVLCSMFFLNKILEIFNFPLLNGASCMCVRAGVREELAGATVQLHYMRYRLTVIEHGT